MIRVFRIEIMYGSLVILIEIIWECKIAESQISIEMRCCDGVATDDVIVDRLTVSFESSFQYVKCREEEEDGINHHNTDDWILSVV